MFTVNFLPKKQADFSNVKNLIAVKFIQSKVVNSETVQLHLRVKDFPYFSVA